MPSTEVVELTLDSDEFVTSIEGLTSSAWVHQLIFVTTKGIVVPLLLSLKVQGIIELRLFMILGRYGPYGGIVGDQFIWAPPGMRLVAFGGSG